MVAKFVPSAMGANFPPTPQNAWWQSFPHGSKLSPNTTGDGGKVSSLMGANLFPPTPQDDAGGKVSLRLKPKLCLAKYITVVYLH